MVARRLQVDVCLVYSSIRWRLMGTNFLFVCPHDGCNASFPSTEEHDD
jgi:hypothetical protein